MIKACVVTLIILLSDGYIFGTSLPTRSCSRDDVTVALRLELPNIEPVVTASGGFEGVDVSCREIAVWPTGREA